jgi:hypothetical protein
LRRGRVEEGKSENEEKGSPREDTESTKGREEKLKSTVSKN